MSEVIDKALKLDMNKRGDIVQQLCVKIDKINAQILELEKQRSKESATVDRVEEGEDYIFYNTESGRSIEVGKRDTI